MQHLLRKGTHSVQPGSSVRLLACCGRGVVAVELEAAESARGLLKQYLDTKHFGEASGTCMEANTGPCILLRPADACNQSPS